MRISTTRLRWLLAMIAIVGIAGTAQAQRNVTLRLNTATLPDTLDASDEIQVRGAVEGTGPFTLPDGNVIDWGNATTLKPSNAGGDYWDLTFQIPDDQKLDFKFFSQLLENDIAGGWEDGDNHNIAAGTGDVELPLHYFEKGDDKAYDWRPWEEKEDTIAVYFRVWMNTEAAIGPGVGYDRNDPAEIVGVRGDDIAGQSPLDWGSTDVKLSPESGDIAAPGFHMFSGVAHYPASLAGTEQKYKFFVEPAGWEGGDDRAFTIPAQDTTLHWVYFSRSKPVTSEPVQSLVIFTVDLSPYEEIGIFDQARGDTLWVLGDFNSWADCMSNTPDQCLLQKVPGEGQFETALPLTLIPEQRLQYKYFLDFNNAAFQQQFGSLPPSGWEEGHATGTNRQTTFEGSQEQVVETAFFNDVHPLNLIPAGNSIDVHFAVDMTAALANQAQPFDPAAGDSVTLRLGDPIWAFTQGILAEPRDDGDFPLAIDEFVLTDDNGDNIYTGTFTVEGPAYSNLTYRFAYGQGSTFFDEPGIGCCATPGRNRVNFIRPNPDGSWPTEFTLDPPTFQVASGAMPFESNPAFATGVEEIDGEIPQQISLGQNYPNPFNPATLFEYAIGETQHVRVKIYDLTGRVVATLVDGVQPAATYRVTFDGSGLASGVYMYQLETQKQTISRKMVLLK